MEFDAKKVKEELVLWIKNWFKENGDGWFLLRLSVHDPIMPLNIESDSIGGVKLIAEKISSFLRSYEGLDINNILDYIG